MNEIYINSRRTSCLKQAIVDSIENGQYDTLPYDIKDCFTEDQIEEAEGLLNTNDIDVTIDDILSEWSGDCASDLFLNIEEVFGESNISIQFDHDVNFEPETDFIDKDQDMDSDMNDDMDNDNMDNDDMDNDDMDNDDTYDDMKKED